MKFDKKVSNLNGKRNSQKIQKQLQNDSFVMQTNNSLVKKSQQKNVQQVKSIIKKLQLSNVLQRSPNIGIILQQQTLKKQNNCTIEYILKLLSSMFKNQIFSYIYKFFLILFFVNSILQAFDINDSVNQITKYIDLSLQLFFTFTILLKLIEYHQQSIFFLSLDAFTNIAGYLSFDLFDYQITRYMNAAKTLRIFFIVKQSHSLSNTALHLINSLRSVGKILFPAAMFIYFYAVIGLFSFRDYQYNKCRDPTNKSLGQNWTVYQDQIFLCGYKDCPILNGIQYECLNPIDYGVQPNQAQLNNIIQGNGLMRYNNIFYALFSTLKQMFVTGSSRLMLLGKQVANPYYVLIYYLSFCYLLSYIYLNIFYGLMMSNEEKSVESQPKIQLITQNPKEQIQNQKNIQCKIKQNEKFQLPFQKQQQSSVQELKQDTKSQLKTHPKFQNLGIAQLNQKKYIYDEQKINEYEQIIKFNHSNYHLDDKKNQKLKQSFKKQKNLTESRFIQNLNIDQNTQNIEQYKRVLKKYYIFNHTVVILCAINICIDYQGQSQTVRFVTDCIDFAFFIIYLLQMIGRYIIHKKYVSHRPFEKAFKMDICLFILVLGNMIYEGVISKNIMQFVVAADNISLLLRTLKYLRLFILINQSPFFKQARIIFNSTFQAIYEVRYFTLLWVIVLLIFSIMGFHLFQGKTKVDQNGNIDLLNGKPYAISFQGLYNSIIFTVFAFYNQQWDWFLFQQYPGTGALLVIWQLLTLIIGLQIMCKYFMALLMNQIGSKLDQSSQLKIQEDTEFNEDFSEVVNNQFNIYTSNKIVLQNQKKQIENKSKSIIQNKEQLNKNYQQKKKQLNIVSPQKIDTIVNLKSSQNSKIIHSLRKRSTHIKSLIQDQNLNEINNQSNHEKIIQQINQTDNKKNELQNDFIEHTTLLSILRKKLQILLKTKVYIYIRIIFIIVNVICTLLMNPLKDPQSQQMKIYYYIWFITVIFFGFQILLSIFTIGIFDKINGYFARLMNWIYFIVFLIQLLNLFIDNQYLSQYLCVRILRIFVFVQIRYKVDRDMRITIVGFWKLLPKVVNLLTGTLLLYGFFAIILVKVYKNDYYYCQGDSSPSGIQNQIQCYIWGGNWVQRKMNVQNVFQSLLYLFLQATTQGWSTQVIQSASLAGSGNQPISENSSYMYYFFSIFFFFGNMIMLNAFLGLSIYNFKKIKDEVTGFSKLTQNDKMWLSIKNNIYRMLPHPKQTVPNNCISQFLYDFIKSKAYNIVNFIFFLLFMINMSLYQTNMQESKQYIVSIILKISIGIFIVEYFISLIAFGFKIVKNNKFILQTIAVVYIITQLILINTLQLRDQTDRILSAIGLCFICIRYFALLTQIQFIKKMINSLITIFPQTTNIWILIGVVLITYATIGIQLFSYLRVGPQLNAYDQNYTTLDKAIFALIKFSILQSPIGQIIDAASTSQPNSVCFDIFTYNDYQLYGRMGCGSKTYSYLFFLSFHIVYSLILMSTLMAVIFDAYSEVRRQQQSMVNKFQLQQVRNQWTNYDPQATGYISYRDFWMFTGKIIKIYDLGSKSLLSNQTKNSFLQTLNIAIYQDQNGILSFQFHQVIESLTRIVLKQKKQDKKWDTSAADKLFKIKNKSEGLKPMKKSFYRSSDVLTLIALKSGLKNWKRKAVNTQNGIKLKNIFNFAKETYIQNSNQQSNQKNKSSN